MFVMTKKLQSYYYSLVVSYGLYKDRFFTFALYLMVFLASVYPQSDRDQGWHYRYGEYFLTTGKLIRGDIYSWTLPGYPWANHSWAYDALFYIWTNIGGYAGLSILAALVTAVTFYFVSTAFDLSLWKKGVLAAFFLLMDEVVIGSGMRSQIISLLFFSILIWILIKARERHHWLWSLPALFLLWTNFHGDFTLGMGILGVYLGSYFLIDAYKERDFSTDLFFFFSKILIICFIATLINPFGYQAYFESFRHASNPYLRNILEWDPINDGCPGCHPHAFLFYGGVFAVATLVAIWKRNWYALPSVLLFLGLVWQTWMTRRLLPIFGLVTLPLLAETLTYIKWEFDRRAIAPVLYGLILIIGLEYNLYARYVSGRLYHYDETAYCDFAAQCPVEGANFLIANPPHGRGFTFYDWGGYLIGKGVPVKLFVDGRMHVWKTEDGYQPFGDYIEMFYHGRDDIFLKYNFDWVFIPVNSEMANKLMTTSVLGNWRVAYTDDRVLFAIRDTDSTNLPAKPVINGGQQ